MQPYGLLLDAPGINNNKSMAFQHEIYLASYDEEPSSPPDGSWEQPFFATLEGDPEGDNADRFDGIMKNLPAGSSVRLLPGTFFTKGNPGQTVSTWWSPTDHMSIRGSGIGVTKLQLVPCSGETRWAVGLGSPGITGFELSDLEIDCGLPENPDNNTRAGAVWVHGSHILLRRIKVSNYGSHSTDPTSGIAVLAAAQDASYNCVIDECTVGNPSAGHNNLAVIFAFYGTATGHHFCTIRNCALAGFPIDQSDQSVEYDRIRAIWPGIGVGTVIEGNQIANCAVGVSLQTPTTDLVIWNNHFRNVSMGIWLYNGYSTPVGRLICENNIIELSTYGDSLSGAISGYASVDWRTGIALKTPESAVRFKQVVLRKNLIRDVQEVSGTPNGLRGVDVKRCGQVIIENNVISNVEESLAVVTALSDSTKFFNNQDQSGTLLNGYNGTVKALELEDAVQDEIMAM